MLQAMAMQRQQQQQEKNALQAQNWQLQQQLLKQQQDFMRKVSWLRLLMVYLCSLFGHQVLLVSCRSRLLLDQMISAATAGCSLDGLLTTPPVRLR
jgi:hypothetical protein